MNHNAPYWTRHPHQLAFVLRFFALILLLLVPLIAAFVVLREAIPGMARFVWDHTADALTAVRYLLAVIWYGKYE